MKKTILQNKGFRWGLLSLFVLAILIGSAVYYQSALAAAELTITPITWDIIGLDSNDETSGPNHFPVGARVCNVGDVDATNVTSTFVWDDNTNAAYIYERPLSLTEYTGSNAIATLTSDTTDNKNCVDFYYEVEVDRSDAAREKSRSYHITASATGLSTVSTPTPRKLFVEYLISQHRNATVDVQLDGVSVPAGGTMALVVGGTYDIKLVAATATQGYNQIESFINFANTIFKINKVSTIYSAYPTPHTDPDWYRQLYADGCTWDSDPNSPLYQSCLGTGKYGGDVAITYNITIIGGAGQTEALNSLIYDFSGSSFHYNADYAVGVRFAAIIDPTTATIAKAFSPSATTPGGVSTLTFTLSNPYGVPLTNASFDDTFPTNPGNMVVANPAVYSTTGCGTPTFAPAAGAPSISFSGGSIPANGTCVVNVQVTVPAAGDYLNISDNLFIDGADTGHHAEDTLTATTTAPPACTPGLELARWEFNGTSFDPTFVPSRAGSATQSYQGAGTSAIAIGGNPANSWGVTGGWAATNTGYPNPAAPYFQFQVNTSQFSGVSIAYQFDPDGNWANSANNYIYTYSSVTNVDGDFSHRTTVGFARSDSWTDNPATALATGSTTTYFRINAVGQQQPTAVLYLDNVSITGCGVPQPPTLTKAFSPDPIAVGGTSQLVFTLTNENNVPLTGLSGVRFTDVLPAGLQVAATPNASTTCGNTPNWAPAAGDTTLRFGTTTGATIPARVGLTNGSCTVSVNVTATTGGAHQNVSGFIYSTQTYTNTTSTGSGTDSLTAILPPQIYKSFNPDAILVNGVSRLTFRIVNPNPDNQLTGVQFSDTFPATPGNMLVATPATYSTSACGTPTFAPVAGAGSISFTNGTIDPGDTCTVWVDVTAPTIGTYNNITGPVSAAIVGNGNTASDSLEVTAAHPGISILKQVSTSATGPWTSFVSVPEGDPVYYRFIVENTGDVALTNVTVTDQTLNPALPYTVCTIGNLAVYAETTCTPSTGSVTSVAGWNYNTAYAHGDYGTPGTTYDSDPSRASYATTSLTLVKSACETAFTAAGDVLHYSYLVTNDGDAPLRGPVTIADDKSTNETCPPVNTVGDHDDWLDPLESITCVATYTVVAADVTATEVINHATATVDGVDSNPDSVTVVYAAADYGDLPASYNITLLSADGPRHTIGNLTLGDSLTTESNGQENDLAVGDVDNGVFLDGSTYWTNNATVNIFLDLKALGGTATVGMWLDWDGDGAFQSDEFYSWTGLTTGNGSVVRNTVQITVPANTDYTVGDTLFVRVRAFDAASIPGGTLDWTDFTGLANNGEVEDYRWLFNSVTAINLSDFSAEASTPDLRWSLGFAGLLLLAAGSFIWMLRRQKNATR